MTTTVVPVDLSGHPITQTPAATDTEGRGGGGGFVQDTSTIKSTLRASDAAAPGANVLFYDGGMECVMAVSSMMALVMFVTAMLLLVN